MAEAHSKANRIFFKPDTNEGESSLLTSGEAKNLWRGEDRRAASGRSWRGGLGVFTGQKWDRHCARTEKLTSLLQNVNTNTREDSCQGHISSASMVISAQGLAMLLTFAR